MSIECHCELLCQITGHLLRVWIHFCSFEWCAVIIKSIDSTAVHDDFLISVHCSKESSPTLSIVTSFTHKATLNSADSCMKHHAVLAVLPLLFVPHFLLLAYKHEVAITRVGPCCLLIQSGLLYLPSQHRDQPYRAVYLLLIM